MQRTIFVVWILLLASINAPAQVRGHKKSPKTSALAQRLSEEIPQIGMNEIKLMEAYITKLSKEGFPMTQAMRLGINIMAKGKALLSQDEQNEMEDLNDEILDSYSREDRDRLESLRIKAMQGNPMSKLESTFLKTVFKKGFLTLPAASQARLRELNGKAIRAFLRTIQ